MKPLPTKIEVRLAELLEMEEFDMQEVQYCRETYWDDRDGWHSILINTYERAKERTAGEEMKEQTINALKEGT